MVVFQKIKDTLSKLFEALAHRLAQYAKQFGQLIDPVKDGSELRASCEQSNLASSLSTQNALKFKLNKEYIFPFLIGLYFIFDYLMVFYCSNFQYSDTGMPRLFTHLVFAKPFWRDGDVITGIAVCMFVALTFLLLLDRKLNVKYNMFLIGDDHIQKLAYTNRLAVNQAETEKILWFRKKYLKFINSLIVIIILDVQSFMFGNFFYFFWTGSIEDYFALVLIMLFSLYFSYMDTAIIMYFVLTVRYIRIKQNARLATILKLNSKLANKCKLSKRQDFKLWSKFCAFKNEMLQLYAEIKGQNVFWAKYVSIYFVVYILEICYLSYALFFNPDDIGLMRQFFAFFTVELILILIVVTAECSLVVYRNVEISKRMLTFTHHYRMHYTVSTRHLVKINGQALDNRNVAQIAFTLSNNYPINSEMFEMLFSYISVLFMMILGGNK